MEEKIKIFSNKKITTVIKFFSVLLLWGISLKEIIVFTFFPLENKMKTLFVLVCFLAILIVLTMCSHVIFQIEKYISERDKILNFNSVLFSVFVSISFEVFYIPIYRKKLEVTSFSRVFGIGFINDWDVARLINNFTVFFFLFAIVFVCGILFESYWERKIFIQKEVKEFCANILIILDSIILLGLFYYLKNSSIVFGCAILVLLIIYVVCYIILKFNSQINFDKYIVIFCCILGASLPIAIVLLRNFHGGKIFPMISIFLCVAVIGFLVLKQHRKLPLQKIFEKNYDTTFLLCGLFPLITSFYMEFLNILNQHSIFVGHPSRYYAIGIFSLLLIALCVDLLKKKSFLNSTSLKKWIYFEVLLGFAFLSINIPLQNIYGANIFESANSSILISDLLNFGKIPIVEHYGGHMLANVLGGIVYGVLNRDFLGAIFTPYNLDYIFFVVILYFFLKECFDEDAAFFSSLFFSFSLFSYFGIALFGVTTFLVYVKNNSCKNAILYWLASILCCIYRLDLGFTVVIPLVFCSLFYVLSMRKKEIAKQQVIGLGVNCIFWGFLWCILCIAKNINPVIRLIEFLKISASNQNWAYATIGDSNRIVFGLFYFVMPLLAFFCLVHTVISSKDKFCLKQKIILLFLGFSYFANFSRGLVRHSLAESQYILMGWTIFLFFAVYIAFLAKRNLFFISIVVLSLLLSLFSKGYLGGWNSIVDTAFSKVEMANNWNGNIDEKIIRCLFSDALKNQTERVKNAMDFLLEDDESYLDFENHSFLYSAVGRKSPVYVAQSPGHLSGEFTQIQFVAEAKKSADEIPLCLMPAGKEWWLNFSLDGIMNNIRYYKVAEYIYQNYRPLCLADETHAIWVRNDKYDEFYLKVNSSMIFEAIDYNYDADFHNYNMVLLPYIWGQFDKKHASKNTVLASAKKTADNIYFIEHVESIDKSIGNYILIHVESSENNSMALNIGNGSEQLCNFNVSLKEGYFDYLIRISSDYNWYLNKLDTIELKFFDISKINYENIKIDILQGD